MILGIMVLTGFTVIGLGFALTDPARKRPVLPRESDPQSQLTAQARAIWSRFEAWILAANLPVSPTAAALWGLTIVLILFLSFGARIHWVAGILAALMGLLVMRWWVQRRISALSSVVAAELPPFLRLLASNLRSGYGLVQALEIVAEDTPPPLGQQLEQVIAEVNMGVSLDAALESFATRLRQDDVDLMVAAILISREVGGNLSTTLSKLENTILGRARLSRQIRVLTAQARLSGVVVALLPLGIIGLMSFVNWEYVSLLFVTPMGWGILGMAALLEAVGIWLIRLILRQGEELL